MACRERGTRRWVQKIKTRRKKEKEVKQNKPKTPKDRAYISTKKRESNKERKQKNTHKLKKAKYPQRASGEMVSELRSGRKTWSAGDMYKPATWWKPFSFNAFLNKPAQEAYELSFLREKQTKTKPQTALQIS